jgi:hypothetical protein
MTRIRNAAFASKATSHPVLIPREVAGHPRPRPPIPAKAEWKGLLLLQISAYPRSAPKRQDRPVTPEVAGSSPVAPVSQSTCKTMYFVACLGAKCGSEIHRLLASLFDARKITPRTTCK